MAVPPNTTDAFMREVDEELRRDELKSAWQRYGKALMAAVVAGLAIFGGVLYYRHWQASKTGEQGTQLLGAYDQIAAGKGAEAVKPLDALAQSHSAGYRAMAQFARADVMLQQKDLKGAATVFAAINADGAVAQPLRDLALIRQTSAEFDGLRPQVVVDRLRPLAIKGNPWFGSAGELVAAAYLQMNRRDLAGTLFGQIAADENAPQSIRGRATAMASMLGAGTAGQSQEKKAS